MADVQVKIGGEDVRVAFGDDTAEAQRQQLLAKAHVDDAAAEKVAAQTART